MSQLTLELLHCPFCDGPARVVRTKDMSGYFFAECSACYARQLAYSKDAEEAATRWNQRTFSQLPKN